MKEIILLLALFFSLTNCSNSDESNLVCVSFDTRQCMGDDWSETVDINGSETTQAEQLKAHYAAQDIELVDVKADLTFHEIVCEACFVCPQNPRFTVKALPAEIEKLRALELLNFSNGDCSDF